MYVTSAGRGRELALCLECQLSYNPGKQTSGFPTHAIQRDEVTN
jgi:hypothetical protein